MDELAKCGRLKNARALKNQRGKLVAENMLRAGMGKKIQWVTETKCRVTSQSIPDKLYDVDIVSINCNCPASAQGGNRLKTLLFGKIRYGHMEVTNRFSKN